MVTENRYANTAAAMNPETKRAIIAGVRRLIISGLILLFVWIVIMALRRAVPDGVADWSTSVYYHKPVAELVASRLAITFQLAGLGGVLGLVFAAALLYLGMVFFRITEHFPWVSPVRSALRSMLVSSGATIPAFVAGILFIAYTSFQPATSPSPGIHWQSVLVISILPAWLLVQAGHGEILNWQGKQTSSCVRIVLSTGFRLILSLLRLIGAILVVTMFVEVVFARPGLGRLFVTSVFSQDFSAMLAAGWMFVLIVVPVKLVADFGEIALNYFNNRSTARPEQEAPGAKGKSGNSWLIVCLVLVSISVLAAVIGPILAPFDPLKLSLASSLLPPSAEHILGSDALGRDVLSRLLFGIRATFTVSFLILMVSFLVVAGWGILAAFLRKNDNWLGDTLEDAVMLPRDIICAFPWIVLPMIIIAITGRPGMLMLILTGSLVLLPRALGVTREAFHSPAAGHGWLYGVLWSLPIMALFTIAGGILFTSSMGYLGLGVLPPSPELGLSINDGFRYVFKLKWIALAPAAALVMLLTVWVMAGDALIKRLGIRSRAMWSKIVE
jgi:peptide/nickel transport system permease protein